MLFCTLGYSSLSFDIMMTFEDEYTIAASAFRCNSGPVRCAKGKAG